MQPRDTTIHDVVGWIQSRDPFSFVRYGNGEWDIILGRGTTTGSRSQVFTDCLRMEMRETVIRHHGKRMGVQSRRYLKKVRLLNHAEKWLKDHSAGIQWEAGDVLHWASKRGELAPFVDAIKQKDTLFVGPDHLMRLPLDVDLVKVQARNCWENVDRIESEIRERGQGRTVCISAGPTAKVLIHRLKNEPMQLIDCGSMWDVYCGVVSRNYHKEINREIAEKNHLAC